MDGSEAKAPSEEEERGTLLGEAMLDGSLMGMDSMSVAETAAGCTLSHPDAAVRKVKCLACPATSASQCWHRQRGTLMPAARPCWQSC